MPRKKKILVHVCCGPCATYVFDALKDLDFIAVGYFYNPNIHGREEYEKRLKNAKKWAKKEKINLIVPEYSMTDYFEAVLKYEKDHHKTIEKDKKRRCQVCFRLRLKETARHAKKNKFNNFTTTLLVSPFQDQALLWQIGTDVGSKEKTDFFFRDFRKGYLASRHMARNHKLYMQKYCGCIYSIDERGKK